MLSQFIEKNMIPPQSSCRDQSAAAIARIECAVREAASGREYAKALLPQSGRSLKCVADLLSATLPLPAKSQSVRIFPKHHRLQYPGSALLIPALCAQVTTGRPAGSWSDDRLRLPWSGASCACHRLTDRGR